MLKTPSLRILALLLLPCMTFYGCAELAGPRPMTKDNRPQTTPIFNGWSVHRCQISHTQSDVRLETDGKVSGDTMHFKMRFNSELKAMPSLTFNTVQSAIAPQGRGRAFAFSLPYSAHDAAQWIPQNAYLIITYAPHNSASIRQQYFPLNGLVPALSYLVRTCG